MNLEIPKSHVRPNGIKVTVNHDWIGVNLGNNRSFTASYGGLKASGVIPDSVFKDWANCVDGKGSYNQGELIERIVKFCDDIDQIWPEWNQVPDTSKLTLGSKHLFKMNRKPNAMVEIIGLPARKNGLYKIRHPVEGIIHIPTDLLLLNII